MDKPKVVLLNDTDVNGHHFGCAKVMTNIRTQLARRGITPEGSVKVSLDWREQNETLVETADLLIINGEGTLHHGSRRGRWLLEAAQAVKEAGGKVALINALWQDNPADWTALVQDADILSCRDSRSMAALSLATGRKDVRFIGDLSMSEPLPTATVPRDGIVFGDSVHAAITARLAELCNTIPNAEIVPVTSSLKFISPHLKGLRKTARTVYAGLKQRRYLSKNASARFLNNQDDYVTMLNTKALCVTGRFHAVCLAIATQTPFVAVNSNSWKIEALIEDIGLSKDRCVGLGSLNLDLFDPSRWALSATESANITARLDDWQLATQQLFDDMLASVKQS
ncbi:MAG: hypothetical protein ACJAXK_001409 [Yoonia sp.]|jgi:hypothetical protein